MNININFGEKTVIPFHITDVDNGLAGKRVTWALAIAANDTRVLIKAGGLPGSSADITIIEQTAGSITGQINLSVADFAAISRPGLYRLGSYNEYAASLWIDDGANTDRCVTAGGTDKITIVKNVSRLV